MSKDYPEKYEPGELSRTRDRIGPLSDDEARAMKETLGGEIGVEKSSPEVDSAYDEMKKRSYHSDESWFAKQTAEELPDEESEAFIPYSKRKKNIPFAERVRMNILCARPEHGIKTAGNAFTSLFSFMLPWKDRVDPEFVCNADNLYYKDVENFVISVRALLSVYRSIRKEPPTDWAYQLLSVFDEWNLESLSNEIGRLQEAPRHVTIDTMKFLVRYLYAPMMKVYLLKPEEHIFGAIRKLYGAIGNSRFKLPVSVERLKQFYTVAVEELPVVFSKIRYRCYPLLLKNCSPVYEKYSDFFVSHADDICAFLGVNKEELFTPEYLHLQEEAENRTSSGEAQVVREGGEEPAGEPDDFPAEVIDGLTILDAMFPEAGWMELEGSPDFYPYFQGIFQLPRGSELISPSDPLQPLLVIVIILQELFYGFRNIEFAVLRDSSGIAFGVKQEIEKYTGFWYHYPEEIIGKKYTPLLYDYCRKMDEDFQFRGTGYGKKLASELMWLKRLYFFPFFTFTAEPGSRPLMDKSIPVLHKMLSRAVPLFLRIMEDLQTGENPTPDSILNPGQPFLFDVESITSYRLKKYAESAKAEPDNTFLLRTVTALLSMLDTLVNNPVSVFYTRVPVEEIPLFRSEDGKGFTVVYSVPERDVRDLLV